MLRRFEFNGQDHSNYLTFDNTKNGSRQCKKLGPHKLTMTFEGRNKVIQIGLFWSFGGNKYFW